ncbi:MAG: hypothetical protein H7645_12225 [Candidatus Heimdallarchaeota archaeon]|nr:hypothetical protein [Candidatus Heimdallarchaeota archaeon]MCK4771091.1 hypothetical protein [Candidatus Heimdallarchaeota archaeon]
MNQTYTMNPFENAKNKISISSKKLYQYLIWATILGLILAVILLITFFVFLVNLGFALEDFDLDNIYESGEILFTSELISTGLVALILLGIAFVALFVIMIIIYVQYYRLGTGFKKLHESEPEEETTKYISYGFYGFVIAEIAGIFIPGTFGNVVTILGNMSLAVGVYLIYQLFKEYNVQGRFKGKPSMLLFIGIALNVIAQLTSIFNDYGSFGSLIGFVVMLFGFRNLSRDIMIVEPPTGRKTPAESVQDSTQAEMTQTPSVPTVDSTNERFCSHCGAKITIEGKFCQSCGKSL